MSNLSRQLILMVITAVFLASIIVVVNKWFYLESTDLINANSKIIELNKIRIKENSDKFEEIEKRLSALEMKNDTQ